MSLDTDAKKVLKEMFAICDGVDVDKIKSDGITVRSGDQLIKLEFVKSDPITVEEEIREEFRSKLHEKMQEIKQRLNSRLMEAVESTKRIKAEAERRERELRDRISRTLPMPEISEAHAKRGLSVVKGRRRDELIWLLRGVYWPKFYDNRPIQTAYSKKMMAEVVFLIRTTGSSISEVTTRQPIGLDFFDHYHMQGDGDCWGDWMHGAEWREPDDIIRIGKQAEAVLENINPHSMARENPRGLPRKATLQKHLLTSNKKGTARIDSKMRRMGVDNDPSSDDIWSA